MPNKRQRLMSFSREQKNLLAGVDTIHGFQDQHGDCCRQKIFTNVFRQSECLNCKGEHERLVVADNPSHIFHEPNLKMDGSFCSQHLADVYFPIGNRAPRHCLYADRCETYNEDRKYDHCSANHFQLVHCLFIHGVTAE